MNKRRSVGLVLCAAAAAALSGCETAIAQTGDTTGNIGGLLLAALIVLPLLLFAGALTLIIMRAYKHSKEQKEALEISQESFWALVRENPNISLMFDDQLNFIECNAAAVEVFGFKDRADALANFFSVLEVCTLPTQTNGKPSVPIKKRLKIVAEQGSLHNESNLNVKGKHYVLDMNYKRIPYGGSFAIVGYANDVTVLREEQEKLRKFADVIGLSGAYIWEFDVKTYRYRLVTENFDWLGIKENFSEGELAYIASQVIFKDDVKNIYNALEPFLARKGEGTFSYAVRFNNFLDGGLTWVRAVGYATEFDTAGNVTKIMGSFINIDDQMRELSARNAELERQQNLFRNIFSAMDAAVILMPDDKPFANEKFDEVMPGWEKEFVFAQDADDLYDYFGEFMHDPEAHIQTIKLLRETRQTQETVWHFKNGRAYSIKGFIVHLYDDEDKFAELWILRDITEIETQRKLFGSIFEAMEPAVLLLPNAAPIGNSGYHSLLPGWEKCYYYGQQDFEACRELWEQYIYNCDEILDMILDLRETHSAKELIWRFRNGRDFWHKGSIVDLGGGNFAELWLLRDITELESTKRMFNEIFNVMDPAVAIMHDGRMFSNTAYDEIFPDWHGIYTNALTGDDEKDFVLLKAYWDSMITNADDHFVAIRNLREKHEHQKSIWHFRDGRECMQKGYWISLGEHGIGGELWVLTDVSEMYEAMQRANEASLAKSMFLSSMSHEIRTPMNAIIGMTSLARKSHDMPRIQRYLEKTEEAGHRLMSLINDVLDMSKIESGKLQIAENEFDYMKMCENAVNVIADKAMEKRIEVKTVYKAKFSHLVWADELRVSQVLVNLLSNAVKFTQEGGHITVTTDIVGASTLRVSCEDDGIGIGEESMPKLFNSFEQADKSITRQFGGTGLGLAICKQIVELMGGKIYVESEQGKGSVFTFEIPFEWRSEIKISANVGDVLSDTRILVVDDEPEITEYFAELLKTYYINADTANSGIVAISLAQKSKDEGEPYKIAFVDWKMPEISGAQTAKNLRGILPECKIVIISAYDWDEIKESFEQCGESDIDFMPKPIPPSDIYNRIISLLDIHVSNANATDFTGKRILLVEDVDVNRLIVTALLEDCNCVIDEAENGKISVEMAQNEHYDLILMDMQMPVMDGLTATKLIRQFDKDTPIIAMTANAFREDADACLEAGMNAHIAKPLDNDVFMRTLAEYLRK
jgi:signal transduction histidine kinase/DNA-binding response OmpR family regulator/PAS domain-containing protein